MPRYTKSLIAFFIVNFIISSPVLGQKTKILNPRVEFQPNPIGLSEQQPKFSWELDSSLENIKQKFYEIKVASSPDLLDNPDIWRSDVIESNRTLIQYPNKETRAAKQLQSFQKYYWNISAWIEINGEKQKIESSVSSFETGTLQKSDWQAQWITDQNNQELLPAPLFRKTFTTSNKEIKSARAYISGLGYCEMFINNERVGNSFLDPGFTAYNKRVLYSSYDVSGLIEVNKKNVVAIVLGNGWFNEQRMERYGMTNAPWRSRPQLLCEIHITYDDGTKEIVISNDTWKTSSKGPYLFNNLFVGDYFDNRLNNPEWKKASFDDTSWDKASITSSPAPVIKNQQMPPIRISRTIQPVSMTKISPNKYVFDMGENFSGFCKLKVKGEKGTKIKIRYSELLGDNREINQENVNFYYNDHASIDYPGSTDLFILRGDRVKELFHPSFTYHGFQYVQIESDKPLNLNKNDLTGCFLHTDVTPVGQFSCSDTTLNKIWKATNQSYLSNLHSFPTDCPTREKNGWTGDAWVAIDLGLLNFDGILVYKKWIKDVLDSQNEKGLISGVVPTTGYFGYGDRIGPVWGAALFIIPNALYNYYGDISAIENSYEAMERYLAYLETEVEDGLLTLGYGDWNSFHTRTPSEYTSTMFHYLDNVLMIKFSKLLNKDTTKYRKKAETLKKQINEKFYDPATYTYSNGSQTAQALALYLGIAPQTDEQRIAEKLSKSVIENFGHLDFGLLGTVVVPRMLTKYGYGDLAYNMIVKKTPPSWGYWVNTLNRTTLQETWVQNFRRAYGGSLNHYYFGDVSAWMYNYLAGINYDTTKPGFENAIINPYFISGIDWVHGEYKSVRGKITSKWKRGNDNIVLEVQIPANTTATIIINNKENKVGSGKHKYIISN